MIPARRQPGDTGPGRVPLRQLGRRWFRAGPGERPVPHRPAAGRPADRRCGTSAPPSAGRVRAARQRRSRPPGPGPQVQPVRRTELDQVPAVGEAGQRTRFQQPCGGSASTQARPAAAAEPPSSADAWTRNSSWRSGAASAVRAGSSAPRTGGQHVRVAVQGRDQRGREFGGPIGVPPHGLEPHLGERSPSACPAGSGSGSVNSGMAGPGGSSPTGRGQGRGGSARPPAPPGRASGAAGDARPAAPSGRPPGPGPAAAPRPARPPAATPPGQARGPGPSPGRAAATRRATR